MDHKDHVALLRGGIAPSSGTPPVWADLGSGDGAFTLALAELLGDGAQIIAVDRDRRALDRLARSMSQRFATTRLETRHGDFTQPLALPPLDGIVMANALHFVPDREKDAVLRRLLGGLRPGGRLLMVEYNADHGNTWVPYPFSFSTWQTLAARAGFAETRLLATVPSRFLREIYSAVSLP